MVANLTGNAPKVVGGFEELVQGFERRELPKLVAGVVELPGQAARVPGELRGGFYRLAVEGNAAVRQAFGVRVEIAEEAVADMGIEGMCKSPKAAHAERHRQRRFQSSQKLLQIIL